MTTIPTDALKAIATYFAKKYGFPSDIFLRQINQESGFNPNAVSRVGAIGVAQIMPATAKNWNCDPHDPISSLDAAAKAMAGYFQTYKKKGLDDHTAVCWSLAAYNAGPGSVAKYNGVPPFGETENYVKVIAG